MKQLLSGLLIRLLMFATRIGPWQRLLAATKAPDQIQQQVLLRILRQQQHTQYGQEHGFARINTVAEFRSRVPVNRHEALRPWIERQERTGACALNAEQPRLYTLTSGTTDKAKLIPLTRSTLRSLQRLQQLAAYAIHAALPGVWQGKVLAIVGAAEEGTLASGAVYGSMSGLLYQSLPALLKTRYVVPDAVFALVDYEQKYFHICLHALAHADLGMIATANPSTLLKLEDTLARRGAELLAQLATTHAQRAANLGLLLARDGKLRIAAVWPYLQCVTLWTGGSCGVLIPKIRTLLPPKTRLVELGYLASEFRGTLTIDASNNLEIPTLQDNFLEFVEQADWEQQRANFLTLGQLEHGKRYYIFPTTASGLYRYDINDIVEVTGHYHNTPTLRFVQKGKGILNLTGEKLSETQLISAVERCARQLGMDPVFFLALGSPEQLQYTLYLQHEPVAGFDPDASLGELNVEYAAKRSSGRLQRMRICWLQEGSDEAYKQHCLARGQRESQFKLSRLQYAVDCSFDFSAFARVGNDATE